MPKRRSFWKWLPLACAAAFAAAAESARDREPPPSQAPAGQTPSREAGGIVAVVGDDVITRADLDRSLRQWVSQLGRDFPSSVIER